MEYDCPYYSKTSKTCKYVDLKYYNCDGQLTYFSIFDQIGCPKVKFMFTKSDLEELLRKNRKLNK